MTTLQKVLLTIFIFLISASYLGWFGTNLFWLGLIGMGFVIAVVVEAIMNRN